MGQYTKPFSPRITANFSRPADNVAYQAGDAIANSTTAASVVPITFALERTSGILTGARCVVTPASGNLVIAALDFDLLLFRPESSIPFAAGSYAADNAAMTISAAAMRELVAVIRFSASNWRSPAGSTSVAGVSGYQAQAMASTRPYAPFNIDNLCSPSLTPSYPNGYLLGVVQAQGAWTPTGVVNRFDFALDISHD